MQLSDLEDVLIIEGHAFRSPWSRQIFSEELEREWAHLDVVRARQADGRLRLVGYCNYWLVRDEIHLLNVAVHPDHRRQGHGHRLMAHMIDFGRRHQCRCVTLEVRKSNHAAIEMYQRLGFDAVGLRPNYYAEDREDAVVMLLTLEP